MLSCAVCQRLQAEPVRAPSGVFPFHVVAKFASCFQLVTAFRWCGAFNVSAGDFFNRTLIPGLKYRRRWCADGNCAGEPATSCVSREGRFGKVPRLVHQWVVAAASLLAIIVKQRGDENQLD